MRTISDRLSIWLVSCCRKSSFSVIFCSRSVWSLSERYFDDKSNIMLNENSLIATNAQVRFTISQNWSAESEAYAMKMTVKPEVQYFFHFLVLEEVSRTETIFEVRCQLLAKLTFSRGQKH